MKFPVCFRISLVVQFHGDMVTSLPLLLKCNVNIHYFEEYTISNTHLTLTKKQGLETDTIPTCNSNDPATPCAVMINGVICSTTA